MIGDLEADDRLGTRRPFGDSHKVKLDKKHSKTNSVKQSKKAFGLWVPPSRPTPKQAHQVFKCLSLLETKLASTATSTNALIKRPHRLEDTDEQWPLIERLKE